MAAGSFVFIAGLIIGSFLNVCIYRLPNGESVAAPPSRCPACKHGIPWYDNIPLVSYALLGGRCRFCNAHISMRYPAVELLTGILFFLLYGSFGFSPKYFAHSVLVSALIVATFVDFAIQEIPDEVSLGGLAAGLAIAAIFPGVMGEISRWKALADSALGAIVGGSSIYLTGVAGKFIFKKEAMGGGDVTLLAMIGAFLGWKLTAVTFFIAPLFGSAVGIVQKIKYGNEVIPYGPYLSLGALTAIFFGEAILSVLCYGLH